MGLTVGMRTIHTRWRVHDVRIRRATCTALAALLGLVAAAAMHWQPLFIAAAAISLGVTALLAGSLGRTLAAAFAALGALAMILEIVVVAGPTVAARLHVEWGWVGYAFWLMVIVIGWLMRPRTADAAAVFGLAELVGGVVAILTAIRIWRRVDYSGDLLIYLVHVEDNQAWVGLTTQVSSQSVIGLGYGYLGPVVPTLIGLLHTFQSAAVPTYNATFSAYAVIIIVVPVIAAALIGRIPDGGMIRTIVVTGLMILWAYGVPYLLFGSYGHLSAIWAFCALLVLAGYIAYNDVVGWRAVAAMGLVFAFGAMWFPVSVLGIALAVALLIRNWRRSDGCRRIPVLLVGGLTVVVLYVQLRNVIGAGASNGVGQLQSALTPLYAAKGGTAVMDGPLFLAALVALVIGAAMVSRFDVPARTMCALAVALVMYVGLVFGGSYYLQVDIGYGPTKIQYIIGSTVVLLVVATALRLARPVPVVAALIVVVMMGAFVYGGAGPEIARSWPGAGQDPIWLRPIEAVSASQSRSDPKPIVCFSNQVYDAYMCTRWASGLTLAGDGPFMDYRMAVINQGDVAGSVSAIVASGSLENADVIVLEKPGANASWGWDLIDHAGRVFDVNGTPTTPAALRAG